MLLQGSELQRSIHHQGFCVIAELRIAKICQPSRVLCYCRALNYKDLSTIKGLVLMQGSELQRSVNHQGFCVIAGL